MRINRQLPTATATGLALVPHDHIHMNMIIVLVHGTYRMVVLIVRNMYFHHYHPY